jgi:hypothetical protein
MQTRNVLTPGNLGTPYRGKRNATFLLTCLPAGREAEVMDLAILRIALAQAMVLELTGNAAFYPA